MKIETCGYPRIMIYFFHSLQEAKGVDEALQSNGLTQCSSFSTAGTKVVYSRWGFRKGFGRDSTLKNMAAI